MLCRVNTRIAEDKPRRPRGAVRRAGWAWFGSRTARHTEAAEGWRCTLVLGRAKTSRRAPVCSVVSGARVPRGSARAAGSTAARGRRRVQPTRADDDTRWNSVGGRAMATTKPTTAIGPLVARRARLPVLDLLVKRLDQASLRCARCWRPDRSTYSPARRSRSPVDGSTVRFAAYPRASQPPLPTASGPAPVTVCHVEHAKPVPVRVGAGPEVRHRLERTAREQSAAECLVGPQGEARGIARHGAGRRDRRDRRPRRKQPSPSSRMSGRTVPPRNGSARGSDGRSSGW